MLGVLSTLLSWHAADPVDDAERARIARICTSYQHNRNLFVDRPEVCRRRSVYSYSQVAAVAAVSAAAAAVAAAAKAAAVVVAVAVVVAAAAAVAAVAAAAAAAAVAAAAVVVGLQSVRLHFGQQPATAIMPAGIGCIGGTTGPFGIDLLSPFGLTKPTRDPPQSG